MRDLVPPGVPPLSLRAALLLLAGALSAAPGRAQDEPTPPEPPPGEAPVLPAPRITRRASQQEPLLEEANAWVITLDQSTEGVSLEQLIGMAQRITGRSFTWKTESEQLLRSTRVRLLGSKRIPKDPDRFYAFFQTLMRIYDFVCVEVGARPLEIIVITYLKGSDRPILKQSATYVLPDEVESFADKPGALITALIPLQNLDAQRAVTNLRTYFPDQQLESINTVGNSNSLLITGFGPTVASFAKLLALIDVPAEEAQPEFEVLPLVHASAQELEPVLRELFTERRRGARAAGPIVRGGEVQGVTAAIPQAGEGEVTIIAHPGTNSLLVLAMAADMDAIKETVARLDIPILEGESNYRVYELKNTDSEELANTLRSFLQETQTALQQQAQAAGRAGAGPAIPQAATEQRTVIVAEAQSNSLLVTASKTRWEEIRELIDRLDQRQPQVLIETALVELTYRDAIELGVELASVDVPGPGEQNPFGFTNFGLSEIQDLDGDGVPDFRAVNTGLMGVTAGILDGDDFALPFILQALRTRTDANILSIPSVLVSNNADATVTAAEEIPVAQSNLSGTGISQTGFQGFQEAGISLSISPSISAANYLRLNLTMNVSNFQGASTDPNLPPPRVTREVTTSVYLPSGSTMVIGGIVRDDTNRAKTSVPILGDIPILGYFFSDHSDSSTQVTLYFFVTPRILRDKDFADLAEITYQRKVDAVEHIGEGKFLHVDPNFRPPEPGGAAPPATPAFDSGAFDIPLYQGGAERASEEGGIEKSPAQPQTKPAEGEEPPPSPAGAGDSRGGA
jgi:general secretion pathway protein D